MEEHKSHCRWISWSNQRLRSGPTSVVMLRTLKDHSIVNKKLEKVVEKNLVC